MTERILKDLNIVVCKCGILLQMDNAKDYQYDWDRRHQRVICPICKEIIYDERRGDK